MIAVLARLLTPADFGVIGAALIVVGFADIFSQLGVGPSLVQVPTLTNDHVRSGFTFSVLLGCAVGGLTWLAAPLAASFLNIPDLVPVLHVLAAIFPIKAVSTVSESLIQRDLNFKSLAGVDVVTYAIGYGGVGIGAAAFGFGVWALVAGLLAQAVMQAVIMFRIQAHSIRPRLAVQPLRELLSLGGGFTASTIFNYVATRGDNIVVGRWLGAGPLGVYDRAYGLMNASNGLLGTVFNRVFFPVFARLQNDPEQLGRAYLRCSALVATLAIPFTLFSVALAPEVVLLALGDQWTSAVAPFQLLSIGIFFRLGYKVAGTVARGCGAAYKHASIQFIYAALVAGGAVYTVRFGVSGVAASTLGALMVNYVLLIRLCNHLTGLRSWDVLRRMGAAMVLGAIVGVVGWFAAEAGRALEIGALGVLLGSGGLVLLVVGGLVLIAPQYALGHDGLWLVTRVAGRMRGRGVRLQAWAERKLKHS